MATAKTRQKILKTFLDLLSQHSYEDVSLPLLAKTADVKLSALRECFSSKRALVEAFAEMIDTAVLDDRDEEMGDQPAHDRLFDILMIRLDHLAPYRDAVRSLGEAVRRDPALALEFNSIAVRSQRWMLIAAGIDLTGIKGRIVTQGLAMAFGRVVETWLDETDEGLPKTMARLDEELNRGEAWMQRLDSAEKFARPIWEAGKRARAGRNRGEPTEEAGAETAES
ncbi:TetR family transcriptional regulator [uncultured Roseibium sp.]|uniref:TetR family transcriptional regulator n=1 Tax=uncultured Roseibium sp. TaxID=1936171 RepID=UPI003216AF7C